MIHLMSSFPSHHLIHTTLDATKILPIHHQEHRKQQRQRATNSDKSPSENKNSVDTKIGQFLWERMPSSHRGSNSHAHRKKQGKDLARVPITMEMGIGENKAGADNVPDQERHGSSRAGGTDHPADERQERHDQRGGGGEVFER